MARLLSPTAAMPNAHKRRGSDTTDKTQPPAPSDRRSMGGGQRRMYLTQNEVDQLIRAAGGVGRHRERDKLMILLSYRHGLRVSETCDLRWTDVDFPAGLIYIRREKGGICSHHTIERDEIRALHRMQKLYNPSPFIFNGEQGHGLDRDRVWAIVKRAGERAGFPFPCHPHMLRHSCGYYLASKEVHPIEIKNYLGHWDLRTTMHYCGLASTRFGSFWK